MTVEKIDRCEACRRKQWRGPRMDQVELAGVGMTLLCTDPSDHRGQKPSALPSPRKTSKRSA
jgi:hypothetical protein